MAAVFLGIVAGHVEEKRSIWIRYCNLNVLVFFFFFFFSHFVFLLRTDDEGSEETMDTESQQKSTLSNDVYKQASLDLSSLVVFFFSILLTESLERMQLQIMLFD